MCRLFRKGDAKQKGGRGENSVSQTRSNHNKKLEREHSCGGFHLCWLAASSSLHRRLTRVLPTLCSITVRSWVTQILPSLLVASKNLSTAPSRDSQQRNHQRSRYEAQDNGPRCKHSVAKNKGVMVPKCSSRKHVVDARRCMNPRRNSTVFS